MCEHCQPRATRRSILTRAGAGGVVVIAGVVLGKDLAEAFTPPFETIGLGEEHIDRHRLEAAPQRHPSAATASQAAPTPEPSTPAPPKSASATQGARRSTTATKGTSKRAAGGGDAGSTLSKRASASTQGSAPPPPIVSRAEWGADESWRRSGTRLYLPVRKLVVHHTASPSNPRDPLEWVRMTYRFHTQSRGFRDLGYNFLIDHRGTIYEGRWARSYAKGESHDGTDGEGYGVMGAHALGVNAGSCGIVLLGNFSDSSTGAPSQAAVASLVKLLAWQCATHQIDPLGSDPYVAFDGRHRTFPNIAGHRDVGATSCPGANLAELLPTIRQTVATRAGRYPARTVNLAATVRYREVTGGRLGPVVVPAPGPPPATTAPPVAPAVAAITGFRILTRDGRVGVLGKAPAGGSPAAQGITDAVAIANGPKQSFLTLDARGGVTAFGGAPFLGSLARLGVAARAADLEATPGRDGYWILTRDGGIYGFGSARHHGSPKRAGVVAICLALRATPSGKGYWVLTADGQVTAFGDAVSAGSPKARRGVRVVDLAPTSTGKGYWVLDDTGRITAFGDAKRLGDMSWVKTWAKPARGVVASPKGPGYSILASDGSVFAFGRGLPPTGTAIGARNALGFVPVLA